MINMEDPNLPEAILRVKSSLNPYAKTRHEVTQIRRILTSHLIYHVNSNQGVRGPLPLSLVDETSDVDAAPHGIRGIRKEYLRCVRANIKARKECAKIGKEHHTESESQRPAIDTSLGGINASLEPFLDLVRQKQRHERLRIVQDYTDTLARKPVASPGYLDPKLVLKDVEALPKVPPEVLNISGPQKSSDGTKLQDLVCQLEKSVLRAKMLLKREEKLLAKIKAQNSAPIVSPGSQLQALGTARNVLITWIEDELARAAETPQDEDDCSPSTPNDGGKDDIQLQLASIQKYYDRYIKARQSLITASSRKLYTLGTATVNQESEVLTTKEDASNANGTARLLYPYFSKMLSVSNEQKAIIQQKSHLTITLAKQLKEASQGLDRLGDESHLLPTHPMPTAISLRKGLDGPISFAEEISNHETPDSSHRARAWVFAAQSSRNATNDTVSEALEDGDKAIREAEQALLDLQSLCGTDSTVDRSGGNKRGKDRVGNIWASLDGNLGVIKGDLGNLP